MDLFKRFITIIDALNVNGVRYILIGGFAVIIYGLPRLTQDLDLLIEASEDNVKKLRAALLMLFNDQQINEITLDDLNEYAVIRYGTPEGFNLDIMVRIGEIANYRSIKAEQVVVEGISINIASLESLYELKKNTVRPVDQRDAIFLQELISKRERNKS
jgi:hypothetical protein